MPYSRNEHLGAPKTDRLALILRWIRRHPLLGFIGLLAPILGFVSAVIPAWEAIISMSGRPLCLTYGNTYRHSLGHFQKDDTSWIESFSDSEDKFLFKEVNRDTKYIYILNVTPRSDPRWKTMLVRLPVCGGASQWTYQNPIAWTDLYQMWR